MSIDRTARLTIDSLFVSPINPRGQTDPDRQAELEASIRAHGILVPLLVRPEPVPVGAEASARYEVIAGSRRLLAARTLGLLDVPVIIRACADVEARALALADNLVRESMSALDEAAAYAAMLAADPRCTVEVVAAAVSRSVSVVRRRLKLRNLVPPVAEACRSGEITLAHAEMIAGLHPDVQPKALEEGCFVSVLDWEDEDATGMPGRVRELVPLSHLKDWIRTHTKIDITQPETIELFPQLAELQAEPEPLLEISTAFCRASDVPVSVLPETKWRAAEAKRDQCEHRQRAVVVHAGGRHGDGLGEIRWVCAHKKCPKHFPPKPRAAAKTTAPRVSWEEREAKRKREQAAYDRLLEAAINALAKKTKGRHVTDAELEQIVKDELRNMPEYSKRVVTLCGGPITLKTFGQALVLAKGYGFSWTGHKPDLVKLCKTHGVDLKQVEKGLPGPAAPATAAPTRTKRKRAGGKTPVEKSIARRSRKGR